VARVGPRARINPGAAERGTAGPVAEIAPHGEAPGDACRDNGLLVSAEENVLMLFPALTVTRKTAQRGLDNFEKSLESKGSEGS
jgi:4-aminobutyrate aminotransferase-like enzyme